MASGCDFEDLICKFTFSKTGIKTCIDLIKKNTLVIRPCSKRSYASLADFWIHVLQHPRNYPLRCHDYKNLYKASRKYELQLRVDGISLKVDLRCGSLTLEGSHVIDWAVSCLPGILSKYSLQPGTHKDVMEHLTIEQMKLLQQDRVKYYTRYVETWPADADATQILEAGNKNTYHDPVNPEEFLKGNNLETYNPTSDLLEKEEVESVLSKLTTEQVVQACVLHRLWRSTLNLWFADSDTRVFLATSHMDMTCLAKLCRLFLDHKLTARVDVLSIPFSSLCGRFADVRRDTIKQFCPKDQVLIEYKIYQNVVHPECEFVTSFIAAVRGNKASILRTNIDFDRASFVSVQPVSVVYHELDAGKFFTYLQALHLIKDGGNLIKDGGNLIKDGGNLIKDGDNIQS